MTAGSKEDLDRVPDLTVGKDVNVVKDKIDPEQGVFAPQSGHGDPETTRGRELLSVFTTVALQQCEDRR